MKKEEVKRTEKNKKGERRLLFFEKRSNQWLDFEYRLYADDFEKAPFCIEVVATNGKNSKTAELEHCFDLQDDAKMFFDVIVRNLVTPLSLHYVYENFCE